MCCMASGFGLCCLTVVGDDNHVDTVVQVLLRQVAHHHTHDPVHLPQGVNHLKTRQ